MNPVNSRFQRERQQVINTGPLPLQGACFALAVLCLLFGVTLAYTADTSLLLLFGVYACILAGGFYQLGVRARRQAKAQR